jgi:hypothetical protein
MKKKYITPSMMAIRVKTIIMLATSITNTSGAQGLGMGGDTDGSITEGNSRRGSFWDDVE